MGLLGEKLVSTTFQFEEDTLQVVFDRNGITGNWMAHAGEAEQSGDVRALAKALTSVVRELTFADGTVYEPTVENLSDINIYALGQLAGRIIEAGQPAESEGKASNERSSTPASGSSRPVEMPPNGQAPSESPTTSAVASGS